MINLYAVVERAEDADLGAVILSGILEKYNWTLHREGENKWTCDSGTGPRALKDCTDVHGFEIVGPQIDVRLSEHVSDVLSRSFSLLQIVGIACSARKPHSKRSKRRSLLKKASPESLCGR
jgi:hypothetical protein